MDEPARGEITPTGRAKFGPCFRFPKLSITFNYPPLTPNFCHKPTLGVCYTIIAIPCSGSSSLCNLQCLKIMLSNTWEAFVVTPNNRHGTRNRSTAYQGCTVRACAIHTYTRINVDT